MLKSNLLTANKPKTIDYMKHLCAICCRPLHTENPKVFFCSRCYHDWEKEIRAKVGWVRFLINDEKKRRRWDTYMDNGKSVSVQLVYLGSEFDVDNTGKLIRRESRNG